MSKGRRRSTYPFPDLQEGCSIEYDLASGQDVRDQLRERKEQMRPQNQQPNSSHILTLARAYDQVEQRSAPYVQFFPEVMFVALRRNDGQHEVYTILRNKAHRNVAYIFGEDGVREPEKDSLLMVPGLVGDYPNFMMILDEDDLDSFRDRLENVRTMDEAFHAWMSHGVLRNSPEFWKTLDWFTEWELKNNPVQGGRFDLKHYYLTRMLMLAEADLVAENKMEDVGE